MSLVAQPPARRYTLADLGLIDGGREETFDGIVKLAARMLDVPTAFLSIIDDHGERQQIKAETGFPSPWAAQGSLPLDMSLCVLVRDSGRSLAFPDLRSEPFLNGHPAVQSIGIVAYLGVPVYSPADDPIGALSVSAPMPRIWSAEDRETLAVMAKLVTQQILLRATLQTLKIVTRSAPGG